MRTYQQIIFSAVFVLLLFACLAGAVFKWDFYELQENRRLAEFPRFRQLPIDQWPRAFEDYFDDHFGFRNTFIRRHSKLMRRFKTSEKVAFGNDGWLFFNVPVIMDDFQGKNQTEPAELEIDARRLASRIDWLKARGIPYLFVIVPNKINVYPEMLPRGLLQLKNTTHREGVLDYFGDRFDANLLDLQPLLIEAKSGGDLYFRTDTHWNSQGAYVGYTNIIRHARKLLPSIPEPLAVQDLESYTRVHQGDLANMSGAPGKHPSVGIGLRHPDKAGWTTNSLTNAVFLTEEHLPLIHQPPCTIHNPQGRGNAVVFHDSFTRELMEFLPHHFENTTFIWRYSKSDLLKAAVEICKPDIVIEEVIERFMTTHESVNFVLEDEIVP